MFYVLACDETKCMGLIATTNAYLAGREKEGGSILLGTLCRELMGLFIDSLHRFYGHCSWIVLYAGREVNVQPLI